MDSQNFAILAMDGDNAGRLVGRSILANDEDSLHEVSNRIDLGAEIISKWAEENGGTRISSGGDEAVVKVPTEAIENIEQLRADYQFATNLTMTVGVGSSLSEAGKALMVGKFRGKNTVVQYDPSIDQEIHAAQDRLSQGTASEEEKKLGEAYLTPKEGETAVKKDEDQDQNEHDCPYCKELDGAQDSDPDHCKYCHDAEQEDVCPYCNEIDQAAAHDPNAEGHPDDCPYCQEAAQAQQAGGDDQVVQPTDGPTVQEPTAQDAQTLSDKDMNEPAIARPDINKDPKMGLGVSMDAPSNSNEKLDQPKGDVNESKETSESEVDDQSKEGLQEIASQIEEDGSPTQRQDQKEIMDNLDAEDIATGHNMEDNVSRPEGYEQNTPSDMGLGQEDESPEESPDLTSVLHEGLDSHADNIQREKVIQMVGEALEGFKGCKDILERAKEQAPQLYTSSIAMLRAMIEMASMLGLGRQKEAPEEETPAEQDQQDILPDYDNLFPQHPDHGGEVTPQADRSQTASKDGLPDYNNLFPQHPSHGDPKDPKQKG